MTDERTQLLAAVLENPPDDVARLVLADKLDECGGARNAARAELIRVQCEIAKGACFSPTMVPKLANIRIGEPHPNVAVPCGNCDRCRGTFATLRGREHAILKRWAASFLPKSMRAGYPTYRVEGNVVWCDNLHGYVAFERGFVARAGCELTLSPGMTGPAALRFGQRVASLFEANPLTGLSVSFEGHARTLSAVIVPPTPSEGRFPLDHWWLGWSGEIGEPLAPNGADPVHAGKRHELGRRIASWLHHAIMAPAERAQAEIDAEGVESPEDEMDLYDTLDLDR